MSAEHFSVDGTLNAYASLKSFNRCWFGESGAKGAIRVNNISPGALLVCFVESDRADRRTKVMKGRDLMAPDTERTTDRIRRARTLAKALKFRASTTDTSSSNASLRQRAPSQRTVGTSTIVTKLYGSFLIGQGIHAPTVPSL